MTFKEKGYRGGRARQRGSRNVGTGLAGARSCFVLLSEGCSAWLSWCWCSLGNMCPARSAGLAGVSRGIIAPSAPCCSSVPLPCSSVPLSSPSVFTLCTNPLLLLRWERPCPAKVCRGMLKGRFGILIAAFPPMLAQKCCRCSTAPFSSLLQASPRSRASQALPSHPSPVMPCPSAAGNSQLRCL